MRNPEFLSRMPSRGAPFFLFSPSSSSFPEHSPAGEKEREKQNREREKTAEAGSGKNGIPGAVKMGSG